MMNRFEISLDRIKKNLIPNEDWTDEDIEHAKTVTDALEKQIPKMVEVDSILGNDVSLRYCPSCGVRFLRYGHGFCGECGQALEWEDSE